MEEGCWGRGDVGIGIWSHERHYHEFESQSPALCMICTVATNMDRMILKRLGCMQGWYGWGPRGEGLGVGGEVTVWGRVTMA